MENLNESRVGRATITNEIIKEIASRGRRFFYHNGKVAELIDKGRIYYKAEYGTKELLCLSVPDYRKPKGWFHGGTLLLIAIKLNKEVNINNYIL